MKVGRERPEIRAVVERDGYCCVACGFVLQCALAAHHRLPRELGGRDTLANLTTLCANCHKTVHWLSVGERLNGREADEVRRSYASSAAAKLTELAEVIRDHRLRTRLVGNRWLQRQDSDGPMPLAEALGLVAKRNHLDERRAAMLREVVDRVVSHLPTEVLKGCSLRLVQKGRFFSINAGNILVFRTPGFPDGVKEADGDMFIIWPEATRISVISRTGWRDIARGEGRFKALPCFNLPLSLEQALKMSEADWATFARACGEAVRIGKTRHWVSNIVLPTRLGRSSEKHDDAKLKAKPEA